MLAVSKTKSRPFPWKCFRCRQSAVVPVTISYTVEVNHDGVVHLIEIPALEVPRCQACGELVFDNIADEQISAAVRCRLHLLKPTDINTGRERLNLTPSELAEKLGVTAKTIADWEEGLAIQPRAMDNFLRVYFAVPEVREFLARERCEVEVLVG